MDKPNVKKMEPQMGAPGNLAMAEQPAQAAAECKYCKPAEGAAAHDKATCPYCQKIEQADHADCPYCAALTQAGEEGSAGQCQYCVEMTDGPGTVNPTTTDSQNFIGQDLNPPEIAKPQVGDQGPIPQGIATDDGPTVNNSMLDPQSPSVAALDPNAAGPKEMVQLDQSKEAMMAIAQQIEGDGGATPMQQQAQINAAAPAMEQIDSTQQAIGTEMEGNVSRPGSYDDNVPGDMGLSDDHTSMGGPDLSQVLQGGLDSQADNIQRERVVQMVAQALEGFKASKQIIERSQQQAPQLYQSSIMMLKAMIEMAKMLGLDSEGAPAPEGNPLEAQPHDEWQNPFPQHPDQGGTALVPGHAAPEGATPATAPAANGTDWNNPFPVHADNGGEGKIGQGVGKLPTSATTQHVVRTPLAEGGINDKGQKKVTDPATGEVRWIDMKQGRVQGPNGIPVKP